MHRVLQPCSALCSLNSILCMCLCAPRVATLAETSSGITISVGGRLVSASDMAAPRVFVEPDVDCAGNWLGCGADCLRFYDISTVVSGQGVPCPHDWSAKEDCEPGEGLCPATDRTDAGKFDSHLFWPARGQATEKVSWTFSLLVCIPLQTIPFWSSLLGVQA
jgi:hypothetical protein